MASAPRSTSAENSSVVPAMSAWLMGNPQAAVFQSPLARIMRRTVACITRTCAAIRKPSW